MYAHVQARKYIQLELYCKHSGPCFLKYLVVSGVAKNTKNVILALYGPSQKSR